MTRASRLVLYAYSEALMAEPYEAERWRRWRCLQLVVHHQAETSAGFLARYRGEDDPLGYLAPRWPDEPLIMGNLSAWESLHDLHRFAFGPGTHAAVWRQRHLWFERWPFARPHLVMWWGRADVTESDEVVPHLDVDAALLMQADLAEHGPSATCFGWGRLR